VRILGIDVETTGLDTGKDRVIEIGAVVYDTEHKLPLELFSSFVIPGDPAEFKLPPEITELTGIQQDWVVAYGKSFEQAATYLEKLLIQRHDVDYVMAHNGENFDRPIILAELARANLMDHSLTRLPWIDSRTDLPHKREPESRRLKHLALDHGFINPFEHRAVFDVLTMLRVAGHYDWDEIVELSNVPWVTVRALVNYDDREKAKRLRYSWEKIGTRTYPKLWVKKIRANQLEREQELAKKEGFEIVKIEG
jgi:DNA polymerase-3 subunit epsilon